jgi:hypothetical protein
MAQRSSRLDRIFQLHPLITANDIHVDIEAEPFNQKTFYAYIVSSVADEMILGKSTYYFNFLDFEEVTRRCLGNLSQDIVRSTPPDFKTGSRIDRNIVLTLLKKYYGAYLKDITMNEPQTSSDYRDGYYCSFHFVRTTPPTSYCLQ